MEKSKAEDFFQQRVKRLKVSLKWGKILKILLPTRCLQVAVFCRSHGNWINPWKTSTSDFPLIGFNFINCGTVERDFGGPKTFFNVLSGKLILRLIKIILMAIFILDIESLMELPFCKGELNLTFPKFPFPLQFELIKLKLVTQ
jgi:hypothetical protein